MTQAILLKTNPYHKSIPVRPLAYVRQNNGYVQFGSMAIGGQADQLATVLRSLADQLERPPKPEATRLSIYDRVLTITPLEVVQHFEQSVILREMAGDVRAVLLPDGLTDQSQLQQDIEAVTHLEQPSLADISEVLTGSRQYGGATYKRVKAVSLALKDTTTTPQRRSQAVVSLKKAA